MVNNSMSYLHLYNYYRGKRVFLTGHTGFKGSWMLYWLSILGASVKGYALTPENNNDHFNLINGSRLCESVIADIRDKERLKKEILNFQPDFIFHLAAQPLVRLSYQKPSETFEINAIGTAYVLDIVNLLEKPCVVVLITTDKVYENKNWHYPYRETDRLGGYDPYSASKSCAELIISSYRNSFFNKNSFRNHGKSIASARAGNVIGGGDWSKDRIFPDIVRALNSNKSVVIRNPNSVRPWQHVLDPIGGYLHLATKLIDNPLEFSDSWNFGPMADDKLTVKELVESSIHFWGNGKYSTPHLKDQPHEAELLKLDISKTINELKWQPKLSSLNAIKLSIGWYKANTENSYIQTRDQITDFINLKT
jgi:CDP-glucose 4,6-dehydratase